jgi:two-component system OmpR family sensor kinase
MQRWPSSLRARLTLWYTLVLGGPLVAFAIGSFVVFDRTLIGRTDQFIGDALSAFARELVAERTSALTTLEAIKLTANEVRFRELQIVVLDSTLRLVASGPPAVTFGARSVAGEVSVRQLADMLRGRVGMATRASITTSDRDGGSRVLTQPVVLAGETFQLAGVYALRDVRAILERVRDVFLIGIPLLLIAASAGGYFLATRSLSPVSAMASRAAEISSSNLHERLPVVSPNDELGGLAIVVNGLLERLERAFAQQRRFMADASHELRTPTAILRTEVDVTLSRDHRTEHEYRESVGVMRDAAQRLTRIVDDLFLLARADAGHLVVRDDALYLDEVVHDAVRAVRQLADQRQVRVELAPLIDAPVRGDADMLGRVLLNLLDNALKYSPAGGTVEVELARHVESFEVAVIDHGPGIPPETHDRVFERFFRADVARSRAEATTTSGAGLGLAIARRLAEAHGGRLDLVASQRGRTEFRLAIPGSQPSKTREPAEHPVLS